MSTTARWLPHPWLSLLLLVSWLLLNDTLSPGHILLGATLGLLIPLFTMRFWPETVAIRKPLLALRLAGIVIYDIIVANFVMSRIVLGPTMSITPAFVVVPLDVEGDFAVSVLLAVISLTPGTVSAELDAERRFLLVHALSEDDPDSLVRRIKDRYEAQIKEIITC